MSWPEQEDVPSHDQLIETALVRPNATFATRLWGWLRAPFQAQKTREWLQRRIVATVMNLLILAAGAITMLTAGFMAEQRWPAATTWGAGALKVFVLWGMAFLPGWLYIRFLGMRARSLWIEYVLTLHRLGWDRAEHLPEPPLRSDFHARWENEPTDVQPVHNIYRQKFEAFYGRQIPTDGRSWNPQDANAEDFAVRTESLFPMFLATAVLAAGWASVLWDTTFLTAPGGVWDALKYGFLGAYGFVLSMLVRRFFQSDLRPSAYASAVLRIIFVLLLVAVLHQVLPASTPAMAHGELALAFLIGFFPLVGLQVIQRIVSRIFGAVVPSLTSKYPLDQLDGFSIWYEARLTEEGVEDMQNLATMNLVDVILHTRVPPGRLVDWIDQAILLMHLNPAAPVGKVRRGRRNNPKSSTTEPTACVALREYGIRTATDLLAAFSVQRRVAGSERTERCFRMPKLKDPPISVDQLKLLVKVLANEHRLAPVWNWQANGVVEMAELAGSTSLNAVPRGISEHKVPVAPEGREMDPNQKDSRKAA